MAKISDFVPDERNANKGTAKGQRMIVDSIQRSKFGRSVLVDKNNKIIAGNKSTEAAAELFEVDSEVIVVESNGEQLIVHKRNDLDLADPDPNNPARQLAYADNTTNYFSFDLDLDTVMADIEAGFDFEAIDLKLPDLGEMLDRSASDLLNGGMGDEKKDTEPVTEVEGEKYHKKWGAKKGDIWRLGNHVIACLDSLDYDNLRQVIEKNEPSFIFADPPYGIDIVAVGGYVGGGEAYDIPFGGVKKNAVSQEYIKPSTVATVGGAGRDNIVDQGKYYPVIGDSTTETAAKSATQLLRLYPNACQVWWGANYYTDVLLPSPGWIIWDKDNTGDFADCEMAWTNQSRAARIFQHRWNGMLKASEQGQRRIHPTQKPIALARWCFENYGNTGDVIIDPFLGSGISVLAAAELGDRQVIGFELEPVYISAICQRFKNHTDIVPELIDSI